MIALGIALELILGLVASVSYSWWRIFLTISCFGIVMGSLCTNTEKDLIALGSFSFITFAIYSAVNIVFINNYISMENGAEEAVLVIYNAIYYLTILKPLLIVFAILISLLICTYQFTISTLPIGIRFLYNKFVKEKAE